MVNIRDWKSGEDATQGKTHILVAVSTTNNAQHHADLLHLQQAVPALQSANVNQPLVAIKKALPRWSVTVPQCQ
jgi:UDP-glucose 6-dehydrogenase